MAAAGPHISISAEELTTIGELSFTNSMLTSVIVSFILILLAFYININIKQTGTPTKVQNLAELIIEFLHNLVHSVTGNLQKTRLFFPLISTFFLFIVLNNWVGLIPGVGTISVPYSETEHIEEAEEHSFSFIGPVSAATEEEVHSLPDDETVKTQDLPSQPENTIYKEGEYTEDSHKEVAPMLFRAATADINTTLALALISVFFAQVYGFKALGIGYLKKFFNFSSPIMFIVGILEIVSEFAKIISFAFRLYGNIFAGEVLLAVLLFLTPVFVPILPLPFYGLEVFVGFIQALVFSMLSLVFFNMATQSHDH